MDQHHPWYRRLINGLLGISPQREKKWQQLRERQKCVSYRRLYTPLELHYLGILNTPPGSDFAALRANYKALLKAHHPDVHQSAPAAVRQDAEQFAKSLITAYNYFEQKRRHHDHVQ